MIKYILIVAAASFLSFTSLCQQTGAVKDTRDGRVYKTIQIGDKTWLAENLCSKKFRNGDPIPQAKTKEEWNQAYNSRRPAWCYYNNDPENEKRYGILYNWYAANDPRGICPKGWHLPSLDEWNQLIEYAGGKENGGSSLKIETGTNETGFNAVLGGYRVSNGIFEWMSESLSLIGRTDRTGTSKNETFGAYGLRLSKNKSVSIEYLGKGNGNYIRCIKD